MCLINLYSSGSPFTSSKICFDLVGRDFYWTLWGCFHHTPQILVTIRSDSTATLQCMYKLTTQVCETCFFISLYISIWKQSALILWLYVTINISMNKSVRSTQRLPFTLSGQQWLTSNGALMWSNVPFGSYIGGHGFMCEDKCQQLRAFRHLTCCLDQTSKVPFLLITTNQCSAYIMTWHASSGPQQQAQPLADLVVAVIHDNLRVEKS